jgi:hypothetical protein
VGVLVGRGDCRRYHILYRETDRALNLFRQCPLVLLVKVLWTGGIFEVETWRQ